MQNSVGEPHIGQWYGRTDNEDIFQVTGLDERTGTIEVQYFDGVIDEIDADTWMSLPLELAEPSEDGLELTEEEMQAEDRACSQAETLLEDPAALERLSDFALGDVAP